MKVHAVTMDGTVNHQLVVQWVDVSHIVDRLHLRFPAKNKAEVYDIIAELLQHGPVQEKLVLHDYPDIALSLGLSTVQLGHRSPPVEKVRRESPQLTIGASVHSIQEAVQAVHHKADYALYGHVFHTASKANLPPQGLTALHQVVDSVSVPVIAIGGITPQRVADVAATGARGIAVQSGIFHADCPLEAARCYMKNAQEVS